MRGLGFSQALHCADVVNQFLPALAHEPAHALPHLVHSDGIAGLREVRHPALRLYAVRQGAVHLLQLLVDYGLVVLVGGRVDECEQVQFVEDVADLEFCFRSEADLLLVVFVFLVDDLDPRRSSVHCKINYIINQASKPLRAVHYSLVSGMKANGITFKTVKVLRLIIIIK